MYLVKMNLHGYGVPIMYFEIKLISVRAPTGRNGGV